MAKIQSHLKIIIFFGVATAVSAWIVYFFYQYSQRSQAALEEVNVNFFLHDDELYVPPNETFDVQLDYIVPQDKPISIATAHLEFPQELISFEAVRTDTCNRLESLIHSEVTNNVLTITKASDDPKNNLPTGTNCFAVITFRAKDIIDQTGFVSLKWDPGYDWDLAGPGETFTTVFGIKDAVEIIVGTIIIDPAPSTSPTNPFITSGPSPTNPFVTSPPSACQQQNQSCDFSSEDCCTGLMCFNSVCIPDPNVSQPADRESINIDFSIKLQAVNSNPRTADEIDARVILVRNGTHIDTRTLTFTFQDNGILTAETIYTTQAPGNYSVLIKPEKHLQKKICSLNPEEALPGIYNCNSENVTLQHGDNSLDFSTIVLLSGDLPPQDGIIDARDIAFIRNNLGNTDSETLLKGDLNYDGIVDSQDYSMIINALAFKYDEEE